MSSTAVIVLNVQDEEYLIDAINALIIQQVKILLIGDECSIELPQNATFIHNEKKLTPVGINLGIINTKEFCFVAICGARSIVSDNYSKVASQILEQNPNIGCVGGKIIHTAHTAKGKAIAAAMAAPFGMGVFSFRSKQKSGYTDTVSVPVFSRTCIEDVGLFDETLVRNQDDDYSFRIKKAGYRIWFEDSISSTYYVRENFKQLAGQFYQYGFWKNYVNKKHRTITTLRQLAPPVFIISQCIMLLSSVKMFTLLLLPYLCTVLVLSLKINRFNISSTIHSISAFFVMHYSYGIGYIDGFIRGIILNKTAPEFVKKITR